MKNLILILSLLILASCGEEPYNPFPSATKHRIDFSFLEESIEVEVSEDTYFFTINLKSDIKLVQLPDYSYYSLHLGYDETKSTAVFGEHFRYYNRNTDGKFDIFQNNSKDIKLSINIRPTGIKEPLEIVFFNANKKSKNGVSSDTLKVILIPKNKDL